MAPTLLAATPCASVTVPVTISVSVCRYLGRNVILGDEMGKALTVDDDTFTPRDTSPTLRGLGLALLPEVGARPSYIPARL